MRYVCEVIDVDYKSVYFALVESTLSFKVKDDETGEVLEYASWNFTDLLRLSRMVYGVDMAIGFWKIRPCDLALYEVIDHDRIQVYPSGLNPGLRLKYPIDDTCTLLPSYMGYGRTDPVFTVAELIYEYGRVQVESNTKTPERSGVVMIDDSTIRIAFSRDCITAEYKILDLDRFNILMAKYALVKKALK